MQSCRRAWQLFLLSYLHLGLSIFTTNPTNVTVCQGSPAVFICAIDALKQISWYSNGGDYNSVLGAQVSQSGTQSTLSVSNTSQLNGSSSIQCSYVQSGDVIYSKIAYLSVQAPPTVPHNLEVSACNATSTNMVWEPSPNVQSPLLSYGVEVKNASGVVVYRGTVTVPQLIISTPDPCDLYEATITAQYMIANRTCTSSSSSKLLGASPSTVQFTTSLVFSIVSQDNVSVNMSVQYQSGVCYYKVMAISGSDMFSFPSVKPLPQNGGSDQVNIIISVPSNKHYNITVTAFNGYGNITSAVAISTFGVLDISVDPSSPTGLVCVFNPGSQAIGCLASLTDTSTGTIYCRVIGRTLNRTVSIATCPSSNGPLSTGNYSVVIYTIEIDGRLSSLAAISGKILNVYTTIGPSTISQAPSLVPMTSDKVAGIIGAIIGLALVIIIIVMFIFCMKMKQKQKQKNLQLVQSVRFQELHSAQSQSEQGNSAEVKKKTGNIDIDENCCESEQLLSNKRKQGASDGHEVLQPCSSETHYAEINTEGSKPLTIHDEGKPISCSQTAAVDEELKKLKEQSNKDKELSLRESQLADKEKELSMREDQLADKDKELSMREDQLADKDKELSMREDQLADKDKELSMREDQLADKDKKLSMREEQSADIPQEFIKSTESVASEFKMKDNLAKKEDYYLNTNPPSIQKSHEAEIKFIKELLGDSYRTRGHPEGNDLELCKSINKPLINNRPPGWEHMEEIQYSIKLKKTQRNGKATI